MKKFKLNPKNIYKDSFANYINRKEGKKCF